jgi:uncharacterized protein (TIGR03435 family)
LQNVTLTIAGIATIATPMLVGVISAAGAPEPTGRSIFATVERLGLGLERQKLPFEFIVMDRLEKVPSAN